MQKLFLRLFVIVALAGCQVLGAFFPASQGVFAAATARAQDLNYLLDLDPDAVTDRDLYERAVALEENYQRHHSVNGILWEARYAESADELPTLYGAGGDSAIFTGFYLAGAACTSSPT